MVHPPSEAERLRALREAELLDTAPDPRFDNITALARDIFGVPVSLISLVDEHRQWFKSNQGLEGVTETERGVAFCDYAIRSSGVFVVEDALQDERFASNPLVLGEPEIRFYAGSPIITAEGYAFGTLCLIDYEPREFTSNDRQRLASLANVVTGLIENHKIARSAQSLSQTIAESALINQMILDSSDAGVLLLEAIRDDNGKPTDFMILAANAANVYFNGSTPDELIGNTMLTRFPALKEQEHFADYTRALNDQTPIRREVFYDSDGVKPHWFDVSFRPASKDRLTVTFHTVTGKRLFQNALEQIVETVPIAASDPQRFRQQMLKIGAQALGLSHGFASRITNNQYEVLELHGTDIGLSQGDVLSLEDTLCDLVAEDHQLVALADFQDKDCVPHPAFDKAPFRSYIGAPIFVQEQFFGAVSFSDAAPRAEPFEDWQIHLMHIIASHMGQAIELQNAFFENRALARELRAVLDNVPARIWYKDDKNTVLRANKAALESVNLSDPAEVEGKATEELFPEMAAKYLADDLDVIESGKARRNIIESYAPKDVKQGWISTDKIPMTSRDGQRFILAVATDISELKENEAKLARLNESLADFAFVAAHDLQAPLRQASLFSELVRVDLEANNVALPEDANEYLTEIEAGLKRMREMVRNLFDLFRLDSEKIEMEPCEVSRIVAIAASQLEHHLSDANAHLIIDDLPKVTGNSSLLTQLFQNLIGNACKYAETDELTIRIWTTSNIADRTIKIFVEDNGVGIPDEARAMIFEPFKRLQHSDGIPGAGIGLSLSRKICALHNADLYVDPDFNSGARFVVSFRI